MYENNMYENNLTLFLREKKRIVNQIKQTMNIDQKQQNNNHTNSNEPNSKYKNQ
jgi:hypothetical protein